MHPLLLFVTLLGLTVPVSATASSVRLPAAVPSTVPRGPNIHPAANDRPVTGDASLPTHSPTFALRPQLEAVLTIQLLGKLTESERIQWTAQQREQLRGLLRPLEQPTVTRSEWTGIAAGWSDLLTPAQRRELDRARTEAEERAARLLSMSRLALLDGPGPGQVKWRYAFAIERGAGLVRRLESAPEENPYGFAPYRNHLQLLLNP